ncbi:MAG: hypothetical protein HYR88_17355 [Verrucomicrobia bacterium]|nr:hypothetical protein [Verrucomicrobiota bacterium]MBI3870916.1 hypothetical protein [Verrucomicrobiota bacterium]
MKTPGSATRYLVFSLALSHLIVGMMVFHFSAHFLGHANAVPAVAATENALDASGGDALAGDGLATRSVSVRDAATASSSTIATPSSVDRGLFGRVQSAGTRIAGMNQEQALSALKSLRQLRPGPDRSVQQQLLMSRLTELNPEMAMSLANGMPDAEKAQALLAVWQTWGEKDARAAADYFQASTTDMDSFATTQRESAGVIAAQLARKDPAQALAWMRELPEEVRGEAYGQALTELARKGPQAAWSALEAIPAGYERDEAVEHLTDAWAAQWPQQTAAWVQGINDSNDQSRAATGLVRQWAQSDAFAATDWVATLQPGAARDAAVVALNESSAFFASPEQGVTWSASIQDDHLRGEALRAAVERWRAIDPDAANAWLQSQSSPSP